MTFDDAIKLIPSDRLCLCHNRARRLYEAAQRAVRLDGEFWECGTYKGGSARLLAEALRPSPRPLRLFDTFCGFAGVGPADHGTCLHHDGAMSYPNVADVLEFVGAPFATAYPGAIPIGFSGLENSRITFAYVDVDLYQPTRDALSFILPRLVRGGQIVIDDCGDDIFPGVEAAVFEEVGLNGYNKVGFTDPQVCWQGSIQR